MFISHSEARPSHLDACPWPSGSFLATQPFSHGPGDQMAYVRDEQNSRAWLPPIGCSSIDLRAGAERIHTNLQKTEGIIETPSSTAA